MVFLIDKFNGGFSTGDKVDLKGSFLYGKNLDIHNNPDQLKVMPKTTKDSGSNVSDLVLFMTSEGINNDVYALGDTGKFYKKTGGSWSYLRTLGGANGQGMNYFNNLIYYASANTLGTYNPSTSGFNESYQALNSATWHPMVNFLDKIIIGNGQYLSSIDGSGIYDPLELTIDNDYRIKSLDVVGGGNWLLIGTEKLDKTDCKLFMWDGFATNYNEVITIRENGINAIVNNGAIVLVNAGVQGNLYQLNGNSLIGVKKIPNVEKNLTALIYPGATCNYQGNPLLAVSTGTSLTVNRGVYSWTSADKNYPIVLSMEYTPSHGNLTGTTNEIGSLFSEGENELYISWKNGSDYGIDLVDGSGVFATAEYHSLVFDAGMPQNVKFFSDIKIRLGQVLATDEKIDVYYKADRGDWTQITDATLDYSVDGAIVEKSTDIQIRASELQIKLVFTCVLTSPAVDSVAMKYSVERKF